jgi:DNA-binding NtrC family response regulator
MRKNKILIVEDNLVWREKYIKWLQNGYEFIQTDNAQNAVQIFEDHIPDLVILDLGIPKIENGLEVLNNIISKGTDSKVIVITSSKDHAHALEAQRRGAYSYFFKGENIKDELPFLVHRALKMQSLERENQRLRRKLDKVFNFENIVAVSKQMQNILGLIERVRNTSESVLITGESGVGKEVIARHIHSRSQVKNGPFVAINCAAMPDTLLENELFGHERGAFTGATYQKKGKIELANFGILFLDEIGDMSIPLQAKLLRVLQEKRYYRLGGTKEIESRFRLLAATNKNLSVEVKNRRFREDLYYRLNVIPIHIPPLRDRPDDIPALIDHFTNKYCQENEVPVPRIESNLVASMSRLNWEGNIRQLENTLKRMLILNHKTLTLSDLPDEYKQDNELYLHNAILENQTLKDVNKYYVRLVLNHVSGNKKEACKILKINFRTLQKKLED